MSVLSKEEFEQLIKNKVGDDTSDESIKFIEDTMDTYNHLESQSSTDWKSKYEENDAEWRKKYTERFFTGGGNTDVPLVENNSGDEETKEKTFDELFEEEK